MRLAEAPTELFYDFACSLSKFNHNRESGYVSNLTASVPFHFLFIIFYTSLE